MPKKADSKSIWRSDNLDYYYQGIIHGEYPRLCLDAIGSGFLACRSMLDVCSGPGAFAVQGLMRGWQVTAIDVSALALSALSERALAYPKGKLTTICANFCRITPPKADIAVAACCFSGEMVEKKSIDKIIAAAEKIALFVMYDGEKDGEFATAELPHDKEKRTFHLKDNQAEEHLALMAEQRGLPLHSSKITCDFGCFWQEDDADLLSFISRKSGVTDMSLLKTHLSSIAVSKGANLWLPNLIDYKLFWLNITDKS